jgi:two-component system cell cycle response regulator DivK
MKKRVLLVEDNPAAMDVMQKELEFLGYEVLLAADGEQALNIAAAELPDIIVMDILMPKMDGLEAASKLRENPKTKQIRILAATAKAMPGDKEQCLRAGCDGYIAKPFTHRELDAAIKTLLDGK